MLSFTFKRTAGDPTVKNLVNIIIGGTAVPTDYTVTGFKSVAGNLATVEFLSGESTKQVVFTATPAFSLIKTISLALQPATGIELGVNQDQAIGDLLSLLPIVSTNGNSSRFEGSSSSYSDTFSFDFFRSGSTDQPLTVPVVFSGTSSYGTDWYYISPTTPPPTSITFAAGSSVTGLSFTNVPDYIFESDESLTVSLVPGQGYTVQSGQGSSTTTFLNDDIALPTVTVTAAAPITEGSPTYPAPTVLPFITHRLLANAHAFAGTSAVFISDNTTVPNFPPEPQYANANFNYVRPLWYRWTAPTTGPVRLKVRYTGAYINYPTIGAATYIHVFKPNAFFVGDPSLPNLSSITDNLNASLTGFDPLVYFYAEATKEYYISLQTIAGSSNVPQNGYIGFELETATQTFFTITRTGSLANTLQVDYTLTPISDRSNLNYFVGTAQASFAVGQSTAFVVGLIHNDAAIESNASITLSLQPTPNYSLGANSAATLTIVDDDVALLQTVNLTVTPSSVVEGTPGSLQTVNLTVIPSTIIEGT